MGPGIETTDRLVIASETGGFEAFAEGMHLGCTLKNFFAHLFYFGLDRVEHGGEIRFGQSFATVFADTAVFGDAIVELIAFGGVGAAIEQSQRATVESADMAIGESAGGFGFSKSFGSVFAARMSAAQVNVEDTRR